MIYFGMRLLRAYRDGKSIKLGHEVFTRTQGRAVVIVGARETHRGIVVDAYIPAERVDWLRKKGYGVVPELGKMTSIASSNSDVEYGHLWDDGLPLLCEALAWS